MRRITLAAAALAACLAPCRPAGADPPGRERDAPAAAAQREGAAGPGAIADREAGRDAEGRDPERGAESAGPPPDDERSMKELLLAIIAFGLRHARR